MKILDMIADGKITRKISYRKPDPSPVGAPPSPHFLHVFKTQAGPCFRYASLG
jgi:hypothetical protein